jgi:ribosome maturation protein Sdo1
MQSMFLAELIKIVKCEWYIKLSLSKNTKASSVVKSAGAIKREEHSDATAFILATPVAMVRTKSSSGQEEGKHITSS